MGLVSFGGGDYIFIHKHLNFTTANLNVYCCGYVQLISLQYYSTYVYFLSVEHPQVISLTFLRRVDIILKFVYSPKIEFIVCGDISINCLIDTHRKNQTHC